MLGFHACAESGTPRARDNELDEVHWVEAEAVQRAAENDEQADFKLPPPVSIARFLIDRWVATNSGKED
jgi:NADH pyrophosphatase NudC (nudix superfamily)